MTKEWKAGPYLSRNGKLWSVCRNCLRDYDPRTLTEEQAALNERLGITACPECQDRFEARGITMPEI